MKQVILVRQDLKLPKGKLSVQVAHASVEAVSRSLKEKVASWKKEGSMKIALHVANEKELYQFLQTAKDDGLVTALIKDAGHTVVEPGTTTCLAIGPDDDDLIDALTKDLKLI